MVDEMRIKKMADKVIPTVPPMKEMPSLRSSSSIPDIPTTYTLLSIGKFSVEERYTAAAYGDPKISSCQYSTQMSIFASRAGYRNWREIRTTCASIPSPSNFFLRLCRDLRELLVTKRTCFSANSERKGRIKRVGKAQAKGNGMSRKTCYILWLRRMQRTSAAPSMTPSPRHSTPSQSNIQVSYLSRSPW